MIECNGVGSHLTGILLKDPLKAAALLWDALAQQFLCLFAIQLIPQRFAAHSLQPLDQPIDYAVAVFAHGFGVQVQR